MRILLLLVVLFAIGGCSGVQYVSRQAWGQFQVLHGRKRIDELLKDPKLPSELSLKLRLVLLARDYAHQELGLVKTGAYTRYYDTKRRPVGYNVSAAPKLELKAKTWKFPLVGAVPYLGFFQIDEAKKAQHTLNAEGYDTTLRSIAAYSSLRWFNDPVFSPMLSGEPWSLVDLVLHETTHSTIFWQNNVAFNESLAVFVAQEGTIALWKRFFGENAVEIRQIERHYVRRERFTRLIGTLTEELNALYRSSLPAQTKLAKREILFKNAQAAYRVIYPDPETWGSFVKENLNNAIVLSYGRYLHGMEFHRRVFNVLNRSLPALIRLYRKAQQFSDPIAYVIWFCNMNERPKQVM